MISEYSRGILDFGSVHLNRNDLSSAEGDKRMPDLSLEYYGMRLGKRLRATPVKIIKRV